MTSRRLKVGILCTALVFLGAGLAAAGDGRHGRGGDDRGRHERWDHGGRHDRWDGYHRHGPRGSHYRHDARRHGYYVEKRVYHHPAPRYAPHRHGHGGHGDSLARRLAPRVVWLGPLPVPLPPPPHVVLGLHR